MTSTLQLQFCANEFLVKKFTTKFVKFHSYRVFEHYNACNFFSAYARCHFHVSTRRSQGRTPNLSFHLRKRIMKLKNFSKMQNRTRKFENMRILDILVVVSLFTPEWPLHSSNFFHPIVNVCIFYAHIVRIYATKTESISVTVFKLK